MNSIPSFLMKPGSRQVSKKWMSNESPSMIILVIVRVYDYRGKTVVTLAAIMDINIR